MKQYRKKPLLVEAVRWMGDLSVLHDWMQALESLPIILSPLPNITIDTIEGEMTCKIGDWIVKGVEGEFYPVKHSIFEKTYEQVTEWTKTVANGTASTEPSIEIEPNFSFKTKNFTTT